MNQMYAKSATFAKRRGGNSSSPSSSSTSSSSFDDGVQTIAEAFAILERDPEWLGDGLVSVDVRRTHC